MIFEQGINESKRGFKAVQEITLLCAEEAIHMCYMC